MDMGEYMSIGLSLSALLILQVGPAESIEETQNRSLFSAVPERSLHHLTPPKL